MTPGPKRARLGPLLNDGSFAVRARGRTYRCGDCGAQTPCEPCGDCLEVRCMACLDKPDGGCACVRTARNFLAASGERL